MTKGNECEEKEKVRMYPFGRKSVTYMMRSGWSARKEGLDYDAEGRRLLGLGDFSTAGEGPG
jgi:hypothetical protein